MLDQHTGAMLAVHLNNVLDLVGLTNDYFVAITKDNAASNYSITRQHQSTLEYSGIVSSALRAYIPYMAQIIQIALGAFRSIHGVTGCAKFFETFKSNLRVGENASIDIWMTQRLRKECNARINMGSAMKPGFARIIEKVQIAKYFEGAETNLYIAGKPCYSVCMDTESIKRVHWLSQKEITNRSTIYYGCKNVVEFKTGVASVSLPILRIHPNVAQ